MDLASIVCGHDGIYVCTYLRSSANAESLAKVIGAGHSKASNIVTTCDNLSLEILLMMNC